MKDFISVTLPALWCWIRHFADWELNDFIPDFNGMIYEYHCPKCDEKRFSRL